MTGKKFGTADAFNLWLILVRREEAREAGLVHFRQRFERGDNSALLDAIYLCAANEPHRPLPLPDWVVAGIKNVFLGAKLFHRYGSWDEAFGPLRPRNQKLRAKRAEALKRARVWVRVAELRRETPHRDVFPAVANEFGLSVAVTKKYFYAADKLTAFPGHPVAMLTDLETLAARLNTDPEILTAQLKDSLKRREELKRKQRKAESRRLRTLRNK